MSSTLGAAVIGLDHWYSAFMVLDEIAAAEDLRLVGIAESNPARLEEARQKHSPERAVTDFRALLDDEAVDIVFSFVNTADNPEICREALGRGKHILCVKPAALAVETANELARAADDAGVFWSSFEIYHRLTRRSMFLKQLLADGVIGEPVSFYHVAHGGLPQPWEGQTGDSWWLDASRVPGGAWIDHAIYAVDQARWLLGREVESVSAVMSNLRHPGLALEDHGIAWMRLGGGFTAVMEDTWTAESGTHFNRFIGAGGSLDLGGETFTLRAKGTTEELAVPASTEPLLTPLARAVRGIEPPPFTNACSVHNLAACLAAYESSRTGKVIAPG